MANATAPIKGQTAALSNQISELCHWCFRKCVRAHDPSQSKEEEASATTKIWKRKRQVRERYGNVSDKWVERMVKAKKLPPPEYPLGTRTPFWDEAKLDESDEAAAAAHRAKQVA